MPRFSHPDSNAEIDVRADQVAMYESQGWEKSPNAKAPQADGK